jgi:hypothetical protein
MSKLNNITDLKKKTQQKNCVSRDIFPSAEERTGLFKRFQTHRKLIGKWVMIICK